MSVIYFSKFSVDGQYYSRIFGLDLSSKTGSVILKGADTDLVYVIVIATKQAEMTVSTNHSQIFGQLDLLPT